MTSTDPLAAAEVAPADLPGIVVPWTAIGDGAFLVTDADGTLVRWTDGLAALTGYEGCALVGLSLDDLVGDGEAALGAALGGGSTSLETTLRTAEGERVPCRLRAERLRDGEGRLLGAAVAVLPVVEGDHADDADDGGARASGSPDDDRLVATVDLVADVRALVAGADDAGALETAVCDRLAERYSFVCTARAGATGGATVTSTAGAGGTDGVLAPAGDWDYAADAIATGTTSGCADLSTVDADWAEVALDRGLASCLVVPVVHHDVVYGALGTFAPAPGAFDAVERRLLEALGGYVGFGVTASHRTGTLRGERTTELDVALPVATGVAGTELDVLRDVPAGHGGVLRYVHGDATADAVRATAGLGTAPEYVHPITAGDGDRLYEVRIADPPLWPALREFGGRLDAVAADGAALTVTVAFPGTLDAVTALAVLRRAFSGASVVAKRTAATAKTPFRDVCSAVEFLLTERQQAVLEAAYFAGYFDPTRKVSGGDVAEALGISRATFHEHLREAHRRLLRVVVEQRAADDGGPDV